MQIYYRRNSIRNMNEFFAQKYTKMYVYMFENMYLIYIYLNKYLNTHIIR